MAFFTFLKQNLEKVFEDFISVDYKKTKEKYRYILWISLFFAVFNLVINIIWFSRLTIILLLVFIVFLLLILWLLNKGKSQLAKISGYILINVLLFFLGFSEGTKSGTYLYYFPLIYSIAILSNVPDKKSRFYLVYYSIAFAAFAMNVIVAPQNSLWQNLTEQQYRQAFIISVFSSIFLTAIFVVSGTIIDKKYTDLLFEQKMLAEEDANLRNTFLSNMGHEMQTPLNSILSAVSFLEKQSLSPMQLEYLNIIQFSCQHLIGLNNDILDHKKIEIGQFELSFSKINLRATLQQTALTFLNDFYNKNLDFKIEIDESLDLVVEADEMRLVQVINNLLRNALKFTNTGYVHFTVKTVTLKECMVKFKVIVQDTGIGIDTKDLNKVFNSFWKAKQKLGNENGFSAGLDLSITHKLLNLMYANLEVESTPNEGSIFTFVLDLPVVELKSDAIKPVKREKTISLKGLKILVAEDNKLTMLLTTRILEEAGALVVGTFNGKDTLQKLSEDSNFNIILLDLNMPEIDGYTAIEEIREHYNYIPTLAFTANLLNNQMYQHLLSLGFLDCVLKPYEPEELLTTVKRFATKSKTGTPI